MTTIPHISTAMESIQLRPALPSPPLDNPPPTSNKRTIIFKHPGYPENYGQNDLLQLYAWDSPNGGLHAGTALLACSLIACNAEDGYLTIKRDGPQLDLQHDDVLLAQEYYFHVPEHGLESPSSRSYYQYPIYPSFRHWAFPHGSVPLQWCRDSGDEAGGSGTPSVSSASAAVIARDKACVVSKHRDYNERAHLCPRSELEWFQDNCMRRYNARRDISGDDITDDTANAIALRADIHHAFDGCMFAVVRKAGCWVAHFLETTYDLGPMYHNRPVDVKAGVAPEFVLVRFAWAVFPLVKAFMEHGPKRVVKVREQCEGELRQVTRVLDPTGFAQIACPSRRRSASPKKRKASEALPPITEAKRYCPPSYSQAQVMSSNTNEPHTPSLSSDNDTSLRPYPAATLQISAALKPVEQWDSEEDYFSSLRKHELQKRRPSNPELICCDYSLAERENALGIPGKPEYGGGHLCDECLGLEYRP